MNKLFLFVLLLCAGCSPNPTEASMTMETALSVAGTKVAIEEIARQTIVAGIEETRRASATDTPMPTDTPITDTYIVEEGYCIMSVDPGAGNPNDTPGCGVSKRYQEAIPNGKQLELSWPDFKGDRQIYCNLYTIENIYIMTSFDRTGSGKVVCHP